MKNIHVLPTSQPSRLVKQKYDTLDRLCLADIATKRAEYKRFTIYITSDEEIKEGDYVLYHEDKISQVLGINIDELKLDRGGVWRSSCKKIILTTDVDLIKDGVQDIDDEFLEWFVKNPTCEFVDVEVDEYRDTSISDTEVFIDYKIIIPSKKLRQFWEQIIEICGGKEEFMKSAGLKLKQETLEEVAEKYIEENIAPYSENKWMYKKCFIDGYWLAQQEKSYSEEEVLNIIADCDGSVTQAKKWFEQFKNK